MEKAVQSLLQIGMKQALQFGERQLISSFLTNHWKTGVILLAVIGYAVYSLLEEIPHYIEEINLVLSKNSVFTEVALIITTLVIVLYITEKAGRLLK